MGFTLYFEGTVSSEQKVDEIIRVLRGQFPDSQIVDYQPKGRSGAQPRAPPKYERAENLKLRDTLQFLELTSQRIALRFDGKLPERYRGVIVDFSQFSEPLYFIFRKYSDDTWYLQDSVQTSYPEIETHKQIRHLLDHLKETAPSLHVWDELDGFSDVDQLRRIIRG